MYSEIIMSQENIEAEASGGLGKDIMAPPPRERSRQQKILLAGVAELAHLITVLLYHREFIVPHESTDGTIIDG